MPLTSTDLQAFIDREGIAATILTLEEDTPTVPDAARVLGVDPQQIIKSLVFMVDGTPFLVIANGLQRVDRRKLAAHFAVGRKRIRFASAEDALAISGYVVGSMPPFGHGQPLSTLLDPGVLVWETVYGGGGDVHAMLRLSRDELQRVTAATLLPLVEDT